MQKFLSSCVEKAPGNFVSTEELFEAHKTSVSVWTDGDSENGQTRFLMKRSSFHRQLKKALLAYGHLHGWPMEQCLIAGKRGYSGIRLKRARRYPPGFEFGGPRFLENIERAMKLDPPPVPPIEIHNVRSDPRAAGACAFASRDIERGEVVVEYTGEVITREQAAAREEIYEREGKTCTLMTLESRGQQIAIDPFYGGSQEELPWGATINHSRNHPNLKPYVAMKNSTRPRVFLVALHDIPEKVEFLWNYNDTNWEYHADSQTIPSTS